MCEKGARQCSQCTGKTHGYRLSHTAKQYNGMIHFNFYNKQEYITVKHTRDKPG